LTFVRGDFIPSPQAGEIMFTPSLTHFLVKSETFLGSPNSIV